MAGLFLVQAQSKNVPKKEWDIFILAQSEEDAVQRAYDLEINNWDVDLESEISVIEIKLDQWTAREVS